MEVLIESDAFLYPSFGLHPWFLKQRSSAWAMRLSALLEKYPQAGVGEIGIDPEPKGNQAESMEVQEEVFLRSCKWLNAGSVRCRFIVGVRGGACWRCLIGQVRCRMDG